MFQALHATIPINPVQHKEPGAWNNCSQKTLSRMTSARLATDSRESGGGPLSEFLELSENLEQKKAKEGKEFGKKGKLLFPHHLFPVPL